jgi:hypothetical protein
MVSILIKSNYINFPACFSKLHAGFKNLLNMTFEKAGGLSSCYLFTLCSGCIRTKEYTEKNCSYFAEF